MKKKGFTLMELLAVTVILAVIALITTPMILGMIQTAEKGAAERSANGYVKALETYYHQTMVNQQVFEPLDCQFYQAQGCETIVPQKGQRPTSGNIQMDERGNINGMITIKNKYHFKIIDGKVIATEEVPVKDFTLNRDTVTLELDGSFSIEITYDPENTTQKDATFVSGDETIVKVDSVGVVTAVQAGTATIFVTCGSITKSLVVLVERNPFLELLRSVESTVEEYPTIEVLLMDETKMDRVIQQRDSLLLLGEFFGTELKVNEKYETVYVEKLIETSSLTNTEKYELRLPFYLYHNGNHYEELTGGFVSGRTSNSYNGNYCGSISYVDSGSYLQMTSTDASIHCYPSGTWTTKNELSFQGYRKVKGIGTSSNGSGGWNGYQVGPCSIVNRAATYVLDISTLDNALTYTAAFYSAHDYAGSNNVGRMYSFYAY